MREQLLSIEEQGKQGSAWLWASGPGDRAAVFISTCKGAGQNHQLERQRAICSVALANHSKACSAVWFHAAGMFLQCASSSYLGVWVRSLLQDRLQLQTQASSTALPACCVYMSLLCSAHMLAAPPPVQYRLDMSASSAIAWFHNAVTDGELCRA